MRVLHQSLVAASKAVTGARNSDQLVRHLLTVQLLRHGRRQFVGYIGVLGPVNQQGWRIVRRDITDRAIWVELGSLRPRIKAGHFFGPEAVLPQVEIETA